MVSDKNGASNALFVLVIAILALSIAGAYFLILNDQNAPTPNAPSAPRELQCSHTMLTVTLIWAPPENDGGSPVLGYQIFKSNSSGDYSETPYATVSNYIFSDFFDTYAKQFYVVKAYNEAGSSPASNEVNVTIESQETPTITMNYQKTADGQYTFTVADVTANDVLWSDIAGVINPTNATLVIPTTGTVGAGDVMVFTTLAHATTYQITLMYEPTASASYSINLYIV
jgi:hypothetical protein